MRVLIALIASVVGSLAVSVQQPLFKDDVKKSDLSAFQKALCDPTVLEITGYLETLTGYTFFYFFESRSNPTDDPFVLWTNGGPGCSSSLGLLMELGPCRVNEGGNGTTPFKYSWTNNANVMFIDQPVGVGFSYAKPGYSVGDSWTAGKDVDAFLQIFFFHYPKYADNEFHAFGESYGGHYIPAIGKAIHDGNVKNVEDPSRIQVKLNSIGIVLGNGWVDQTEQTKYFPDMACDPKYGPIVSEETCQTMRDRYPLWQDSWRSIFSCVPAATYCGLITDIQKEAKRNPYDVRQPCEVDYLIVKEKLGVTRSHQGCSSAVGADFMKTGDSAKSTDWMVAELLEAGIRALVYAGDADYVCNWYSNLGWLKAMDWVGSNGFNETPDYPFMSAITGKQAGEFRTYGNLTWVKLFDSGHMAPYDQPEHSLEMLEGWVVKSNNKFVAN
ncbi:Alpha/Beta hydrolase protein [Chytridium lagenaria]|nr:Alpha/Beta hydrolase protein [Chytridium lagenaria]